MLLISKNNDTLSVLIWSADIVPNYDNDAAKGWNNTVIKRLTTDYSWGSKLWTQCVQTPRVWLIILIQNLLHEYSWVRLYQKRIFLSKVIRMNIVFLGIDSYLLNCYGTLGPFNIVIYSEYRSSSIEDSNQSHPICVLIDL